LPSIERHEFGSVSCGLGRVGHRQNVCETATGRRAALRDAHDKGHINRLPSYGALINILEAEGTFDVLKALIVQSAKPLTALETSFACDSSGFSGCRFDRW
jgi:hypothetical protein